MDFFTLQNGLQVVFYPVKQVPLVAVNLWYAVGSKDEKPGKTGFAHLFEHLMFEGSRNVLNHEHFLKLERVGGVANGSTWLDHTNYYETLGPEHLELALFLESDRMGYLLDTLEQKKLDGQRAVVKNERRWRVDNRPYGIWDERLYEMAFPEGHPYHHPVIGYMEDLDAATLADVEDFFKTYYSPSNAVLTIAGKFNRPEAKALVRKYFDPIPAGKKVSKVPAPPVAPPQAVEDVVSDHVALPRIYLLYHLPTYGEAGYFEAEAAQYLLGEGRGSILHRDLVLNRRIATSTSASFMPAVGVSTLAIIVTGTPKGSLDELKRAVLDGLEAVRARGVSEPEAARAIHLNQAYGLMQWESLTQKANLLSEATLVFGDPGEALRRPQAREKVTRDTLNAFLAQTLRRPPILLGFVPNA